MERENIISAVIITLLVINFAGIYAFKGSSPMGGLIHNIEESFDEGIAVDGTTVIDGDGNFNLSGTLDVDGESDLDKVLTSGDTATSTLSDNVTLTAAQMCDSSYIGYDPNGSGRNVTTADAADLIADCMDETGKISLGFVLENLADAAESLTVVVGTNVDLLEPSGGDVVIDQNEEAYIKIWRQPLSSHNPSSTIKVYVESIQAAD